MITAKEAKHKVMVQTEVKEQLEYIEKLILKAVSNNRMYTDIPYRKKSEHMDVIIEELENLGYMAEYKRAEPMPPGCPADQWYSEDKLCIWWDKEE